jgi:hypothetical protein
LTKDSQTMSVWSGLEKPREFQPLPFLRLQQNNQEF